VNWRKVHRENVLRDNDSLRSALRKEKKLRRESILSKIRRIDIDKVLREIDLYGNYNENELGRDGYDGLLLVALRYVAYKYGLGFEMREHKSGYVVAGACRTYDVILTRKS